MAEQGKRKSKSRPTTSARNRKQKEKAIYSKKREDAQLQGKIPTTPEGAVRDERVDPATQESQQFPGLVRLAINSGWAVPDEIKPALVGELVAVIQDADTKPMEKVFAFSALAKADKMQHDRDNPQVKEGDKHIHLHQAGAQQVEEFAKARAAIKAAEVIEAGSEPVEGLLEVEAEVRALEVKAGIVQEEEES